MLPVVTCVKLGFDKIVTAIRDLCDLSSNNVPVSLKIQQVLSLKS